MIANRQTDQLLRRVALSAAVLLLAAPAAFADPPGYLFMDTERSAPTVASAPMRPQSAAAANSGSAAGAAQLRQVCAVPGFDASLDPHGLCAANLERLLSQSDEAQNRIK